jgi:sulfide dehydrogenase cytochrome subunit
MKSGSTPVLAGMALLMAASAHAQGQEALNVRALAATCAACHGTDGRAVGDGSALALAGLPRDVLAAQLRAFKAGTRPSTIMGQLGKGFSETQIDQLAAYFSAVKP